MTINPYDTIDTYMAGIYQGGYFLLIRVTFFETLRADLEDYFKCMT